MALDRPFDDGRVQTANVAMSASTVFANITDASIFHVQGKTTFTSPTFQTDETAETGVSDQRGRRKRAELHTSGAKRAET